MKRFLFLSVIIFINLAIAFGQTTFFKTYGGGFTAPIVKTNDNGYIAVGTSAGVYVVKTDSEGVFQWNSSYAGTSYDEQGGFINITADGGYIASGFFDTDIDGEKAFLMKISAGGAVQWTRTYGVNNGGYNDAGNYVLQTQDKGYLVTGYTGADLYLFKTDSVGTQQWTRRINGVGSGQCIQPTSDGNYVILGTSNGLSYLAKISLADSILWEKFFLHPGGYGLSFKETTDKGFIITGGTINVAYLLKTDSTGTYQWAKGYSALNKQGASVVQAHDGGFAFVSYGKNISLFKTAPDGSLQWARSFLDTNGYNGASTVLQTNDKGYIIGGMTGSLGQLEGYLLKTDSMGYNNCNESVINPTVTDLSLSTTGQTTSDSVGTDSIIYFNMSSGSMNENVVCYRVSGINKFTQQSSVSIYPNPTSNQFTIETNATDKVIVDIFDINGRHVFKKSINSQENIDVTNLHEGVYSLTIKSNTGVTNKKLVIAK